MRQKDEELPVRDTPSIRPTQAIGIDSIDATASLIILRWYDMITEGIVVNVYLNEHLAK